MTVAARSGETENAWVADSWWGGDYLKVGPITQSKRLAKYNQLLVLDRELGLAWRGGLIPPAFLRAGRGS